MVGIDSLQTNQSNFNFASAQEVYLKGCLLRKCLTWHSLESNNRPQESIKKFTSIRSNFVLITLYILKVKYQQIKVSAKTIFFGLCFAALLSSRKGNWKLQVDVAHYYKAKNLGFVEHQADTCKVFKDSSITLAPPVFISSF